MTGTNGRLKFGPQEWIGIIVFLTGILGAMFVDWRHTSERLLILEQSDVYKRATLEDIKQETKLIPRIDQRLMAIEAQVDRRPLGTKAP